MDDVGVPPVAFDVADITGREGPLSNTVNNPRPITRAFFLDITDASGAVKTCRMKLVNGDFSQADSARLNAEFAVGLQPHAHGADWSEPRKSPFDVNLFDQHQYLRQSVLVVIRISDPRAWLMNDQDHNGNAIRAASGGSAYANAVLYDPRFPAPAAGDDLFKPRIVTFKVKCQNRKEFRYAPFNIGVVLTQPDGFGGILELPTIYDPKVKNDGQEDQPDEPGDPTPPPLP